MDKLLLHICCGPCAVYPTECLKTSHPNTQIDLWFYNPNIHPKSEFRRRRDGAAFWAMSQGLTVDFSAPYEPEKCLALLAENPLPPNRCRLCYSLRFKQAAQEAALRGYSFFATTLAFSKRQNHGLIIEEGNKAAATFGVNFYYEDWRDGWQEGRGLAKQLGLYQQNYCGCIYSEIER
ncbi:MAG: epoxyqueuosine reductase QueH [Candidatus Adiutrix sp.]